MDIFKKSPQKSAQGVRPSFYIGIRESREFENRVNFEKGSKVCYYPSIKHLIKMKFLTFGKQSFRVHT